MTYCQCNTLGFGYRFFTRIKGSQQHSNNQTCFKSQILRKTTTITHQKLQISVIKKKALEFEGALFCISFGEKTSTVNRKSSKSSKSILSYQLKRVIICSLKRHHDTKHSGTLEEQEGNHEVCSLSFSLLREKQMRLCCFQNKRNYHQSHVKTSGLWHQNDHQ